MNNLMCKIRDAIIDGTFNSFWDSFSASYEPTDEKLRIAQKQKWLDMWNRRETTES